MKLAPGRIERFLDAPAGGAALIYGPDAGLVRERAVRLARAVAGDADDPFRVAVIAAARLHDDDDPALLAAEAAALPMTGGRRVVSVRDAGDGLASVFERFLASAAAPAFVVVEAGELGKNSNLRRLFEAAPDAAAIACYRDEGEGLVRLIAGELARHGLVADAEATEYLAENLGGDRAVTRAELEKLALYMAAAPERRVGLEDAAACVGDSAAFALDDLVFALGDGDQRELERDLERHLSAGVAPVTVLRAAARHFLRLHRAVGQGLAGGDLTSAIAALKPQVFYKYRERFRRQAERWTVPAIAAALGRCVDSELMCKRTGMPDATLCRQALMEIAGLAPRGRR